MGNSPPCLERSHFPSDTRMLHLVRRTPMSPLPVNVTDSGAQLFNVAATGNGARPGSCIHRCSPCVSSPGGVAAPGLPWWSAM